MSERRITVVGGGPGGLYAAILLRRADPESSVTVYERNAPDDTFGWGVVFSAATLAELADADAPSHEALTEACARWDPVDVRVGGQTIRARGNRFAAISRKRLLQILQERCRDLGADLRFRCELDPPGPGSPFDADLVIAADGVNSRTRAALAQGFGPRLVREGGKFIWLGTTMPLDAFTFVFTRHEAGPFQVHAYPFDEDTSTFIVECDEGTWRRAGLDASTLAPGENDEHALRFCEELFAEHLDGHRLLGNNSRWLDWYTVTNRHWYAGNVVLLGDAAHTAHFSIGSGTKLAMEDAIALARALEAEGGPGTAAGVAPALSAYESDRKPVVQRLQEAAGESLDWFARYHRYLGFDPPAFAYSLLTRSRRVTYQSLRLRDPSFVTSYDRYFAERCGAGTPGVPLLVAPQPSFTPCRAGGMDLPNRLVLTPERGLRATEGLLDEAAAARLAEAGAAGAGLLLADLVAVSADGRISPDQPGCYSDAQERRLAEAFAAVRERGGSKLGVQLVHAGARGATRPRSEGADRPLRDGAWPLVAPSPVPYAPWSAVPEELDRDGMDRICEEFAQAAARAARAGADLVELHLAHGYLLGAFLSPLTNRREDAYGGGPEQRLAFPLEVVRAVRAALPDGVALSACLGASDLRAGGIAEDEAVEAARALSAEGVALFDVVAGQTTSRSAPVYGTAHYAPWADVIRNRARVPVMASGSIPTPMEANHVLAAGQADLCILGRPLPPAEPWLTPGAATAGPVSAGTKEQRWRSG